MFSFDFRRYGPSVEQICQPDRQCDLGPGLPNQSMAAALGNLDAEALIGRQTIVDFDMVRCCISGLWLFQDFLDESHVLSQQVHTTTGSYWHAIMHRREPDYSNSKYWYRKVPKHEIFVQLCESARQLAQQNPSDSHSQFLAAQTVWDPFAFVDLCQAVASGQSDSGNLACGVATLEWQLLFDFCYRKAIGQ